MTIAGITKGGKVAGVLMTDTLVITVKYGEQEQGFEMCYGDYFKALYEKVFEAYGIEKMEQPKFGIYEPTGAKLPKTAQIYNVAEVSDGIICELKSR